jgi:hypothetical protein
MGWLTLKEGDNSWHNIYAKGTTQLLSSDISQYAGWRPSEERNTFCDQEQMQSYWGETITKNKNKRYINQ